MKNNDPKNPLPITMEEWKEATVIAQKILERDGNPESICDGMAHTTFLLAMELSEAYNEIPDHMKDGKCPEFANGAAIGLVIGFIAGSEKLLMELGRRMELEKDEKDPNMNRKERREREREDRKETEREAKREYQRAMESI